MAQSKEEANALRRAYWAKPENKARKKANSHKSYLRHKTRVLAHTRENLLKNRFGITVKDYDNMLEKQHGVCKICGKPPGAKRLHVDHDHKTGKVRALLCYLCNVMLGNARDEPTILRLAALYLEEHGHE